MLNRSVALFLSTSLICLVEAASAATLTSIADHGAVGDGKTLNTKAIQAVIDQLAAAGGGTLDVPAGTFLSGALFFKPGVNLHIEKDGVLQGSTNQSDYPVIHTRWEGEERPWTCAFLNFDNSNNLEISGEGTVDGSGDVWLNRGRGGARGRGATTQPATRGAAPGAARGFGRATTGPFTGGGGGRPRLICLTNCQHVHIADLHLQKQAIWCLHLLYCQDVTVENVNINAMARIPSSDGIDVDSSRDIKISHCTIACNDDDIAIKSGKDADGRRVNRPTENVTISDCNIGVGDGIAMGSEVTGSVRHVLVERCTFTGTNHAARIKSQPSRGGEITDIVFRDFILNNPAQAVDIEMAWDMRLERQAPATTPTDCHNIQLIHITGTARSGGVISGIAGGPVHDVKFVDCNITAQSPLRITNAHDIDTTGLKLTVPQGPPIVWPVLATQPAQQ